MKYCCPRCNKVFESKSKKPLCPDCKISAYTHLKKIKPNEKQEFRIKKLLGET